MPRQDGYTPRCKRMFRVAFYKRRRDIMRREHETPAPREYVGGNTGGRGRGRDRGRGGTLALSKSKLLWNCPAVLISAPPREKGNGIAKFSPGRPTSRTCTNNAATYTRAARYMMLQVFEVNSRARTRANAHFANVTRHRPFRGSQWR